MYLHWDVFAQACEVALTTFVTPHLFLTPACMQFATMFTPESHAIIGGKVLSFAIRILEEIRPRAS